MKLLWIKGITNECWFQAPGMTIDMQGAGACTVCREIRFNDETLFADFPTQTPEIPASSCYELDGLDLIIKELPAREPICVYELDGYTVYSSSLSGYYDRITLPHTGLYIVRVGDKFNKIMIY